MTHDYVWLVLHVIHSSTISFHYVLVSIGAPFCIPGSFTFYRSFPPTIDQRIHCLYTDVAYSVFLTIKVKYIFAGGASQSFWHDSYHAQCIKVPIKTINYTIVYHYFTFHNNIIKQKRREMIISIRQLFSRDLHFI